jgi:predicted Zn-dependent protease
MMTGKDRRAGFFDTHPMTPDRVERLTRDAMAIQWVRRPEIGDNSAAYLQKLDGLLVGPNPAAGVFQGRKFLHPVLDFSIIFPDGWKAQNTPTVVLALEPNKAGLISLSAAAQGVSPQNAAASVTRTLEEKYGVKPSRSEAVSVGPYPGHLVTYTDTSGDEPMHIHFLWFSYRGRLYQFLGLGPERLRPAMRESALTFRPLTVDERGSIRAVHLHLVEARANEKLASLSQRANNVWKLEYTALVNGLDLNQRLKGGQLVKIAVVEPYLPGH